MVHDRRFERCEELGHPVTELGIAQFSGDSALRLNTRVGRYSQKVKAERRYFRALLSKCGGVLGFAKAARKPSRNVVKRGRPLGYDCTVSFRKRCRKTDT